MECRDGTDELCPTPPPGPFTMGNYQAQVVHQHRRSPSGGPRVFVTSLTVFRRLLQKDVTCQRPLNGLCMEHVHRWVMELVSMPGTRVAMNQHPSAIFIGDALGLDFLNSVATPVDTPIDWIDNGEGLLDWLEQAQLVPADALASVRAQALPGEFDKVADQARHLREWFRG